MVRFTDSIDDIKPAMLEGFFEGWINRPSKEMHLKVLENSYAVVLAVDDSHDKVAGFITVISDGVLSAHISFFEVLPHYRSKGLGRELLRRMLAKLNNLYAVSLMCDEKLQPFYSRFGMSPRTGMNLRNYEKQSARQ
jgi:ribosomal protein S18 acetylase RimI-like enzyme